MKKQLIIIGIIVILLAVGLSGCNEEKTDEEKLIGTWTYSQTMEGQTVTTTYTFFTNKTLEIFSSYGSEEYTTSGVWKTEGKELTMTVEGQTVTLEYALSNNDKTLTITDSSSGTSVSFTKQ